MTKKLDKATSKPKAFNTTKCWVWEVISFDYDDYADTEIEKIEAVFFDPWKAVNYAIQKLVFIQLFMQLYTINKSTW